MSIATEITRIQQAKADIKTAIEAKGVTVPSSATIDTYDDYVSQISGGGGGSEDLKKMIDRTITSIVIPSDVTTIGQYAFYNCDSLQSVTIPNSVTSIGINAFYQCINLTSIDIPDSVTSINASAFRFCRSLTSVTIGSGVRNINANAFLGCYKLTSIIVNAITPPALANVNAFNSTNDCPIYVPSESVEVYKAADNWSSLSSRIQAIPNS